MKKTFWDLIKLLLPMSAEKRHALSQAALYLSEDEQRILRQYLKLDRTFPVVQKFHTSATLFEDKEWPFFKSHIQDEQLHRFLASINSQITEKARAEAFQQFAPHALEHIQLHVGPNLLGMEELKAACAIQLFATPKEPVHVLLIGDPGTGKTDILRSLHALSPVSSFGLGSGTSGAGLSAMAKGDDVIKGLLPLADSGIACIDELNLMRAKDMASLYNAMEKGFITYDKGAKHEQLPARVRVCATANPAGDTFIGKSAEILKKQIPFDDALLSRFHLIFLVRKPTDEEFEQIASHIVKNEKKRTIPAEDAAFIKAYVERSQEVEVELDPRFEQQIVAFIKELKADERHFVIEVGPRTVVGVVRIVKAVARAELSQSVDEQHLRTAFSIVRKALYVRQREDAKQAAQRANTAQPAKPQQKRGAPATPEDENGNDPADADEEGTK
jgi:DNA replicative helicase MCM subunit Mcm2 (Cdc46/Mcm family)